MKRIFFLTILLFSCLGVLSQRIKIEKSIRNELYSVVTPDKFVVNSYLDSLFNFAGVSNDNVIVDNVEIVLNRYELFVDLKNYERVAMVYDNGRPIVKSIQHKSTGITCWNNFHENGQIRRIGYSIGYILSVGSWAEFDERGNFVGVFNAEKGRTDFCDVYRKAVELGVSGHDVEFLFSEESRLWTISDLDGKRTYTIDSVLNVSVEDWD